MPFLEINKVFIYNGEYHKYMPKTPKFFDKFTTRLKDALVAACEIAIETRSGKVRTDHLLYGMLLEKGGIAAEILKKGGVDLELLRAALYGNSERDSKEDLGKALELLHKFKNSKENLQVVIFSSGAKQAISKAVLEASKQGHGFVGTEHLLAGIMNLPASRAVVSMKKIRANTTFIKRQVEMVLRSTARFNDLTNMLNMAETGEPVEGQMMPKQDTRSPIEAFCQDLTNHQYQKDVDPVIGREQEIDRVINILGRRTKNNPIIVGEPGVGKTALVEGLAKKMLLGEVPTSLQGKRIISLDLAQIVAGTIFRGEFEARIKGVLTQIEKDSSIILFIDEIHSIMGLGSASGSMDAATMLKPALTKPNLQVIGTTTLDEYRKNIEKDPALERRFQKIVVKESSREESYEVIKGVKENYERYHQVNIPDEIIALAIHLADRYIQDRALPDKAIDILDEAASKRKVQEKDSKAHQEIRKHEADLDDVITQKEHQVRQEKYDEALAFRKKEIFLNDKIRKLRQLNEQRHKENWPVITTEDIAKIISQATNIPVTELVKQEKVKLMNLEKDFRKKIIGQDEAVGSVARFIRRSRSGVASPKRPIGSFMFLGPTGVGKTELAKVVAEVAFEDEDALTRVDMSEFSEKFNISKLIGAPAGYVGFEEGGKLTESVRKKPYSVVLFDEIEKAHPDVFNLLLQVLEDGILTDASGRTVNFRNTIIIMTSNTGTDALSKGGEVGFSEGKQDFKQEKERDKKKYLEFKDNVLADLNKNYRPEFLNRIDKIIVFKPLSRKAIEKIVDLQLAELQERLHEKEIVLQVDIKAKKELAKQGFDVEKGARPLRRLIQESIEDPLAEALIKEKHKPGDKIAVGFVKKKFTLKHKK